MENPLNKCNKDIQRYNKNFLKEIGSAYQKSHYFLEKNKKVIKDLKSDIFG